MMLKNKLFTPIDGVIVEIQKETNTAGIELPKSSSKKNEGIIISDNIFFSPKKMKELKFDSEVKKIKKVFKKGIKIKFLEGYSLEDNLFFILLDEIIGIFKN